MLQRPAMGRSLNVREIAERALATRPRGADLRGVALRLGMRLLPVPREGPQTTADRLVYRHHEDERTFQAGVRRELALALLLRHGGPTDKRTVAAMVSALGG